MYYAELVVFDKGRTQRDRSMRRCIMYAEARKLILGLTKALPALHSALLVPLAGPTI
jgi:hypothetical protein